MIRIEDQNIKDALAQNGNQEYMARAPHLWIFIADINRNYSIACENNEENEVMIGFDKFIQAFTDAIISAQNVVNAAESMGLGTNYFGDIHNDTAHIIELLNLPKLTYPAVGLGFGIPNQDPQIKPKMSMDIKSFIDKYEVFDNYNEVISEYDKEMQTYYDLRDENRRSDKFSTQIIKELGIDLENSSKMFKTLLDQGFILNKE
ncbi:nitroreductase family protein [Peptoniphilus olsenii]|uniref:nitroreductase family protein n=1 Tax=Peptoniphilus olsenii TaxID=411570 RepID=UPI003F491925